MLIVSGCGSHVSAADAFVAGTQPSCLVHQVHQPAAEYRGGPDTRTDLELRFLGYFTAHGTQRFCDNRSANKYDKAWGALYEHLTNNPAKVRSLQ